MGVARKKLQLMVNQCESQGLLGKAFDGRLAPLLLVTKRKQDNATVLEV